MLSVILLVLLIRSPNHRVGYNFGKIFTRDSRYCPSVCPSVRHTGGSIKNGAS